MPPIHLSDYRILLCLKVSICAVIVLILVHILLLYQGELVISTWTQVPAFLSKAGLVQRIQVHLCLQMHSDALQSG